MRSKLKPRGIVTLKTAAKRQDGTPNLRLKKAKQPALLKWYEAYKYWRPGERTPSELISLSRAIIKFVDKHYDNPDFKTLGFMLNSLKVDSSSLGLWVKSSEELRLAKQYCMQVLADKRERMALEGKIVYQPFKMKQYQYDKRWKDAEEYQAALKVTATAGDAIEEFQKAMKHVLEDLKPKKKK